MLFLLCSKNSMDYNLPCFVQQDGAAVYSAPVSAVPYVGLVIDSHHCRQATYKDRWGFYVLPSLSLKTHIIYGAPMPAAAGMIAVIVQVVPSVIARLN